MNTEFLHLNMKTISGGEKNDTKYLKFYPMMWHEVKHPREFVKRTEIYPLYGEAELPKVQHVLSYPSHN